MAAVAGRWSVGVLVLAGWFAPLAGHGAVVTLPGVGSPLHVPVRSLTELRFGQVVQQEHDFSCGAAALATLLTYHHERAVSERAVFDAMYKNGDQATIRAKGFSLLDMKHYLAGLGLQADGYRLSLDRLRGLGVAVIALIDTGGYQHFVVIKGIDQRAVLVGDPAQGVRSVTRAAFLRMWNGIAFVIKQEAAVARRHFNEAGVWDLVVDAPLGAGMAQVLTDLPALPWPLRH